MARNNADEIIPGLWLGNYKVAVDEKWLGVKGVKCVFNCTKDIPFSPVINNKYRIPVDDNLEAEEIRNLELWSFEIVFKIMREYKKGGPILVHCAAGMQRSAACTAMFLIVLKNMTPSQAVDYIQERRPIAFTPGVNFKESIEGFYHAYQKDIASKLYSS